MSQRVRVIAYHLPASAFAGLSEVVDAEGVFAGAGQTYVGTGPQSVVKKGLDGSRPVVLVGFSAGVQAVRTHLETGDLAGVVAVIALDGTHASIPPQESRLKPWREAMGRPGKVTLTSSRIVPPDYASTRTVIGALGLPEGDGVFNVRGHAASVRVVNTPGKTGSEHVLHAQLAAAEVARALDLPIPPGAPAVAYAPASDVGPSWWGRLAAALGLGALLYLGMRR